MKTETMKHKPVLTISTIKALRSQHYAQFLQMIKGGNWNIYTWQGSFCGYVLSRDNMPGVENETVILSGVQKMTADRMESELFKMIG